MLASRFCRQRLAHPWGTEQVDHEPAAFVLHEVVEDEVAVVRLHERLQRELAIGREYEVRERFVVPDDRLDLLDVELDCKTRMSVSC